MAETVRFELTIHVTTYDDLANRCLQPLGHVSVACQNSRFFRFFNILITS